jgi:peptidoglycan/xylan/chitin deacetylase (PgdA/CDA1 family)
MQKNTTAIFQLLIVGVFLVLYGFYIIKFTSTGYYTKSLINTINNGPGKIEVSLTKNTYDIPVITYHYVEIVTDKRDFIRKSLSISPSTFEQQIIKMNNAGYEYVFVREIPCIVYGGDVPKKKPVALTFDDGYADFYTDVFPILKKYNVKATVYLISSFTGGSNYMTKAQVAEIIKSGLVEVGAHSVHHYNLTTLNKDELKNEIVNCKTTLEADYNIKVQTFAYPYGFYNNTVIQQLKDAGFKAAVSEVKGSTQSQDNLFYLSRVSAGSFVIPR